MFNNLKLSSKIIASMSIIIVGMLIISVSSYKGIEKIGNEIEEISLYEAPLLSIVVELEKNILKEEILVRDLIIASKNVNSNEFKSIEGSIAKQEQLTNEQIEACKVQAIKAMNHAHDENLKKRYQYVLNACEKFTKEQKEFEHHLKEFEHSFSIGQINNINSQTDVIFKELIQMEDEIINLVHKMEELSEQLTLQAQKDEHRIILIIQVISMIVLLIAIVISILLTKNVKNIIDNFQLGLLDFFKYLNKETSEVKLLNDESNDEIGVMAKVVNENIVKTQKSIEEDRKIIDNTIEVLSDFEQGDLSKRITLNSSNPALNELKNVLNKMGGNFECNINKTLSILDQYSNYNYINQVDTLGIKEHLLRLANGVNSLGQATTMMLINNKTNGLTLEQSSNTLLKNVQVLNNNSNEAAVSLEQTAAALEEVTSTIVSNTQNVMEMAQYSEELTKEAINGQVLANDTATSMDDINEQVSAINESISIIEQIAFQTNILSLNAAVEAATAGEAGKGFAVVAQEVRNLASRSAEAANEIKALVETATQKATLGKDISSKMKVGYKQLNETIEKTSTLISNIKNASKEQQIAITQVNDTVNNLDKKTQEIAVIASHTNDISLQTSSLSTQIVQDVDNKEFVGKNNIDIK